MTIFPIINDINKQWCSPNVIDTERKDVFGCLYSYEPPNNIVGHWQTTYMTMVPWDYNGAERLLLSSNIIAINNIESMCYLCVCGDTGINKPIVLLVELKYSTCSYNSRLYHLSLCKYILWCSHNNESPNTCLIISLSASCAWLCNFCILHKSWMSNVGI